MSPWELLHAAEALDGEAMSPAARSAQERCHQLSMRLGSASNERLLHGLLPRSAVVAFVAADSSSKASQIQQMAALKQVQIVIPTFHTYGWFVLTHLIPPVLPTKCRTWRLPAYIVALPMQNGTLLSLPHFIPPPFGGVASRCSET